MSKGPFLQILGIAVALTVSSANSACNHVEFVSRSCWGARRPTERQCMKTPVPHVFIHHTAMEQCWNKYTCSAMMRTIQNMHMDDNGWSDIGYSFLIGGDGKVYEGRGWTNVGAHTPYYNNQSIGISFMGNYMETLPSKSMLNASLNLISCGLEQGYIKETYQLHGHRDGRCTLCPGDKLYDLIKKWPRFVGGRLPHYAC